MTQLLTCQTSSTCPYLYTCVNNLCQHNGILPLTVYTVFVYLLIPFFLALANIGGVSGGYLKVPLFMDLLDYPQTTATFYTYPMIFGGGLANFLLLVPQRHPTLPRPLVDYNIVNVLLPCVIFGSTIGVICNLIIPELGLDILTMGVFGFIAYLFIVKYQEFLVNQKIKSGELSERLTKARSIGKRVERRQSAPTLELVQIAEEQETQSEVFNQVSPQLQQLLEQDKGMKLKNVGKSFLIFAFFETMSLLIEGKLIKFNICQAIFFLLFLAFLAVLIVYLLVYFNYQKGRYALYQKIQYKVEVDLSNHRNYIILCIGGVLAGFTTGVIAAGCGHILILFMLSLNVNPKIASATSGYQVMFIGASSTIQALVQGSLDWQPMLFFLLLSLIGSFILSIFAYRFFDKMPDRGQGKIIIILIVLSLISIIGVIPNIIITQKYYGWQYLLSIQGFGC